MLFMSYVVFVHKKSQCLFGLRDAGESLKTSSAAGTFEGLSGDDVVITILSVSEVDLGLVL